jgi:RHS repeat-associated protein
VVALVSAADGTVAARYEYGPFGELLRATGPMAKANPFLYSTKYYDWETGLYYYGYRYYDPSTGKWLSRDPIGEGGGRNLYGFCSGDPISRVDYLGLKDQSKCCDETCDTKGQREILDVLFILLPSTVLPNEKDVADDWRKKLNLLCKLDQSKKQANEIVVNLASETAKKRRLENYGVALYTVIVWRSCADCGCRGLAGFFRRNQSPLHWTVPFDTNPARCNPEEGEHSHPIETEAFLDEASAQAAQTRCKNKHIAAFNEGYID